MHILANMFCIPMVYCRVATDVYLSVDYLHSTGSHSLSHPGVRIAQGRMIAAASHHIVRPV